jgi:carboxyl-terminal processing protease
MDRLQSGSRHAPRACLTAAVLAVALVVVGCSSAAPGPASSGPSIPSGIRTSVPAPRGTAIDYAGYVKTVLDILQRFYFRSSEIDWATLRTQTLRALPAHPSAEDAYAAIATVIFGAYLPGTGGRLTTLSHSQFYQPGSAPLAQPPGSTPAPNPRAVRLSENIGYLFVPQTNPALSNYRSYATRLQDGMRTVDNPSPACGWVVDLRSDSGGTIGPMLLGLGPLLGRGVFLSYVGTQGTEAWSYGDGQLLVNGQSLQSYLASAPPSTAFPYDTPYVVPESPSLAGLLAGNGLVNGAYVPHDPGAPVAVLTSELTGSSGEGVLVGFLGRPKTRVFGEDTFGVPTGDQGFFMVDGAELNLATARSQDRLGRRYDGPIGPDVTVAQSYPPLGADQVLRAATGWLLQQKECAGHAG